MSSSEKRFGISEQPSNTCPDIDGLIDSIPNIGCYDDDGDLIEVDPDYGSIKSAQGNVEDIKSWQEDWLGVGNQLYDRIDEILEAINHVNNSDDENDITFEQEAFYHFYNKDEESLSSLKDQLEEHLKDFEKSIKSDFWDCESAYSDIYSAVDSNDENSVNIIEAYRESVVDFRSNGNHFKELIRDNALYLLPEEIDEPSIVDQYEYYLEKKEEEKILENLKRLQNEASESNSNNPDNENPKQKTKRIKPR